MDNFLQLASNQRDVWQDQAFNPNSPVYNIGGTLFINGTVNYPKLNQAVQYLVNENEAFRVQVDHTSPSGQSLIDSLKINLEFIDFSKDANPLEKSEQWLDSNFKKAFTLKNNSLLWQFTLIKETEERYYIFTKYHHVIADGWSGYFALTRLAQIYNDLLKNRPIVRKTLEKYLSFIEQEKTYFKSLAYQSDKQYWKKILPALPLSLIARRYPISENSLLPHSNIYRFQISRTFYNQINQYSKNNKCTSYHSFLSALAIYFSRIYQRSDIMIGVPSTNRSGAKYKEVIGMFISLSPLILNINPNDSTTEILIKCKKNLRELYRHKRFPLGHINKNLKLLQNSQDTLFDIMLSYENHKYSTRYGDASIQAKQQFSGISRYPLAVTICEFSDSDDIDIVFEGAENCFTSTDLKSLSEYLILILKEMLTADTLVKDIPLLTKNDNELIFNQFNSFTLPNTDNTKTVIDLFQQQVKTQPHKIAVEDKEKQLSYQQLDNASTQLANYILDNYALQDNIIALYIERSIHMIVGILAVLKTASAYLPIPNDIPDERIRNILQQSQAKLVLSQKNYREHLQSLTENIICIDDYPIKNIQPTLLPQLSLKNLAYTIFTSGSSGKPKGVLIDHTALSLRLIWLQSLFKLTPNDRMGQSIPYNFDPSIIEIFLSLTQGACLVLIPENHYTNERFGQFIINKSITTIALVPSSIRMLLQTPQAMPLRVACCGGERLEPSLAKQFLQHTDAQLFNVYGPTESTIIASAWQCNQDFSENYLPIGSPAANTPIYITDSNLNILPVNVIGEICITGETLSQGYINQDNLTQAAFPIWERTQEKIYKTNDRGYIGHDGLLYFSDRLDRQIKISGYRIELGEIESILQQHININLAATIVHNDNNQQSLYAYIETPLKNTESLIEELSLSLRQNLPSYMQPRKIIALNTIAITETGKVDYTVLPIPTASIYSHAENIPRNALEIKLLKIWKKTLSTNEIGIYDNFFEFGGDSLTALNLMISLEKQTGTRYPLSFILENPSIATQSAALQKKITTPNFNILNTLSYHSNVPDIFIAASGHGDILRLSNLADSLANACNIHILQPPEPEQASYKPSIHDIAQQYAQCIIENKSSCFYLSGFSVGGITALETAKILLTHNIKPQGIILLDSIYPRWPLQSPLLFNGIKYISKLLNLNKKMINNRRLGAMLNDTGINMQLSALTRHTIQSVNLPIDLILTQGMWMFHPLLFSTWVRLFKHNLTHHTVSGLHGEMFQNPHLTLLTNTIKKIIKD